MRKVWLGFQGEACIDTSSKKTRNPIIPVKAPRRNPSPLSPGTAGLHPPSPRLLHPEAPVATRPAEAVQLFKIDAGLPSRPAASRSPFIRTISSIGRPFLSPKWPRTFRWPPVHSAGCSLGPPLVSCHGCHGPLLPSPF